MDKHRGHDEDPGEAETPLHFYLPAEQEAGTYAHAVAIWHTAHDFTLDFAATQQAEPADRGDPEGPLIVPACVVAGCEFRRASCSA
jgi:hypothetical protein